MEFLAVVIPALAVAALISGIFISSKVAIKEIEELHRETSTRAKVSRGTDSEYDASDVPMTRTPLDIF